MKAPKRFPFRVCDDITGAWRRAIIKEHLQWMEARQEESCHEKDFSDAPLAKFAAERRRALAVARMVRSGHYRNTKRED